MSSTYRGAKLCLSIFGQSHSGAVGMTLDGLPAGLPVDTEALQRFLDRRAPGRNAWSTPRKESDVPEFLCGLKDGFTCGAPLTAILRNTNTVSKDYDSLRHLPRPGHADYTAQLRHHGYQDAAGGGHFSGRLTAPLCVAGGVCLQALEARGVSVHARILRIADVRDDTPFEGSVADRAFPAADAEAAAKMIAAIEAARADGDSVGGVVECVVRGFPAGLGSPFFDSAESRLSHMLFSVPAVKGVEFGAGFGAASLRGSENNDAFRLDGDGHITTAANRAGGILGGITVGTPIVFRAAFKPTPSISKPQQSVDWETMEEKTLRVQGRHDPCIVPRAVPVVEAAAAVVLYDMILEG